MCEVRHLDGWLDVLLQDAYHLARVKGLSGIIEREEDIFIWNPVCLQICLERPYEFIRVFFHKNHSLMLDYDYRLKVDEGQYREIRQDILPIHKQRCFVNEWDPGHEQNICDDHL